MNDYDFETMANIIWGCSEEVSLAESFTATNEVLAFLDQKGYLRAGWNESQTQTTQEDSSMAEGT